MNTVQWWLFGALLGTSLLLELSGQVYADTCNVTYKRGLPERPVIEMDCTKPIWNPSDTRLPAIDTHNLDKAIVVASRPQAEAGSFTVIAPITAATPISPPTTAPISSPVPPIIPSNNGNNSGNINPHANPHSNTDNPGNKNH